MGMRDLLRFYFELSLPDKAMVVIERLGRSKSLGYQATSGGLGPSETALSLDELKLVLQKIDVARYGGLSFSTESLDRMTVALRKVISTLTEPPGPTSINAIAQTILDVAASGERDPSRLAALATMASGEVPSVSQTIAKAIALHKPRTSTHEST